MLAHASRSTSHVCTALNDAEGAMEDAHEARMLQIARDGLELRAQRAKREADEEAEG